MCVLNVLARWTIGEGCGGKHGEPRLHDALADYYASKGTLLERHDSEEKLNLALRLTVATHE